MKTKRLNARKLMLSLCCVFMAAIFAMPFVFCLGKTTINSFANEEDEDGDIELEEEDKQTLYNMILEIESEIDVQASLEEQIDYFYLACSANPDIDQESMEISLAELTDLKSTYENYRESLDTYFNSQNVSVCGMNKLRRLGKLVVKIALACVRSKLYAIGFDLTTECLTHAVYNEVYDSIFSPVYYYKIYDSIEYDDIVNDSFKDGNISFNSLDNKLERDLYLAIHEFSYTKYTDDDGNCKAKIEDTYYFDYMSLKNNSYIKDVIAIINNFGYMLFKYDVLTQYKINIILNV